MLPAISMDKQHFVLKFLVKYFSSCLHFCQCVPFPSFLKDSSLFLELLYLYNSHFSSRAFGIPLRCTTHFVPCKYCISQPAPIKIHELVSPWIHGSSIPWIQEYHGFNNWHELVEICSRKGRKPVLSNILMGSKFVFKTNYNMLGMLFFFTYRCV